MKLYKKKNPVKNHFLISSRPVLFYLLISLSWFTRATAQRPALIEFGWDYPDASQLSKRIDSMQGTPFDGICFSLQRKIMEAFDTVAKNDHYFEYEKLKKIKWGQYQNNFIIVRGFSKTGGNWFDDTAWVNISNNMACLSKSMQSGNLKGILFDPEYYYTDTMYNPWTYKTVQYPGKSLAEVQQKVRERGAQFMAELQKYKPSFTFISIWLTSLIAVERIYTPIEKTRFVLLIPFIEGMLKAKNKTVTITDGNEYAYWNNKPSQFLESGSFLKKNFSDLAGSEKAKSLASAIETAQPLFYDGLMATAPAFDKGFNNEAKWKWLDENVKQAYASADKFIWFYSQRINWWQGKVNDTLVSILETNKSAYLNNNRTKRANHFKFAADNINSQKGIYYLSQKSGPAATGSLAFTFKWNRKSKKLTILFTDKIPLSVSVYTNNLLQKNIVPKTTQLVLSPVKFSKGKLVILTKYADNTEAAGIQVYN